MSDQPIEITETTLFDLVDKTMRRALKTGDMSVITDRIHALRSQGQMTGLALAKLLYEWRKNCADLGTDPADFGDTVFAETGISHQTTRKYANMWESVFVNSGLEESIIARLITHPIKTLLLVSPAAREEQLDEDTWEEIAEATDEHEVKEIIKRIRGNQTSSNNAIIIRVTREGVIEARRGEDAYVQIGYLALNKREEDEMIDGAISRIIRAAGIIEQ